MSENRNLTVAELLTRMANASEEERAAMASAFARGVTHGGWDGAGTGNQSQFSMMRAAQETLQPQAATSSEPAVSPVPTPAPAIPQPTQTTPVASWEAVSVSETVSEAAPEPSVVEPVVLETPAPDVVSKPDETGYQSISSLFTPSMFAV